MPVVCCCVQALRHGGLLLVRDHGLYDITQLRIPRERQVGKRLFRRLDGTLCYFFRSAHRQNE
jgi:methyltransferase-like protein 6